MFPVPFEVIITSLVVYLATDDLKNLSTVNHELRDLLVGYIFPSFRGEKDPDHKNWRGCVNSSLNLTPPCWISGIRATMPLSPALLKATTIKEADITVERRITYGEITVAEQRAILSQTHKFFKNLRHLKICYAPNAPTGDGEIWSSLSFKSLVSLTIPLLIDGDHIPEYLYAGLGGRRKRLLRTLHLYAPSVPAEALNRYRLPEHLRKLISGKALPDLELIRLPFGMNEPHEHLSCKRNRVLCELLQASVKHGARNGRSTPWKVGCSERSDAGPLCTMTCLGKCICIERIPMITSVEYMSLLNLAHKYIDHIRIPELFYPRLIVQFSNLYSATAAYNHPAALTKITGIHIFFPPVRSIVLANITHLILSPPDTRNGLRDLKPRIPHLGWMFPALRHLSILLPDRLLWSQYFLLANDTYAGFKLPRLNLHTLDVNARIIGSRQPCGHVKLDFGRTQAEFLRIRNIVSCPQCWSPVLLRSTGTKAIELTGLVGDPDDGAQDLIENELKLGERQIRVPSNFVGQAW